ncbi:hypothetical protein Aph01nite_13570 [Acrocarpospora phusangensis]|uniref:Endonuclease/exonuclease/phosphatase domain-containing protein n=1 Tax=Acrocarpospora phusangensis TaxID=1070424 RepID=A0A919Q669_9ACTN|nr:endonuclease/exonuclease/phosphatase family protein [Acrocarpospora phusangensis]GIH23047.1 hypothetical protein Aph01nite_13570 [Acrocarpospora phusangensis]
MIRVASYNVRALWDDRQALARVIGVLRPDVLCVQEAPRGRPRALPGVTGLRLAAGARTSGVAVLTGPRAAVVHAEHHRLRWFPGLERRAIAIAVVDVDGTRLAVGSVHLDLHAGARLSHVREVAARIEAAAAEHEAVPVVAGDINEEPAGPAWRYLSGRFTDGYATAPRGDGHTYSAKNPQKRIDGVFVGHGLTVHACGDSDEVPSLDDLRTATDHRPVVADLSRMA